MTRAPAVLDDIRVLDLGRFIAAPYCGMVLADMGAEVIRVERPSGELDRHLGRKAANGENLTFPCFARNKKGVSLDLFDPASRPILVDLIAASDVVIHNFGPAAARALRLTYEDVREVRPDVIYVAVSCYGSDGPSAERTGFDPIAQAASGAMSLTGVDGEAPLRAGVPWVDCSTGLTAAVGVMMALRHRDRTGEGQAVDCAMLRTAVGFTAPMIAEAVVTGQERPRLGNRVPYLGPCDLYRCRDGHVYATVVTASMWCALARLIDAEHLLDDERYPDNDARFARRAEIDPLVEAWMAERTVDEVVSTLDGARIPCAACVSTADVPDDPQVQAQRMLEWLDLGTPGMERVPICGVPIRLSRTPGSVRSPPPRVGEHNHEIYCELLGRSTGELAELEAKGII